MDQYYSDYLLLKAFDRAFYLSYLGSQRSFHDKECRKTLEEFNMEQAHRMSQSCPDETCVFDDPFVVRFMQ